MESQAGFKRLNLNPLSPERPYPRPLAMSRKESLGASPTKAAADFILEETLYLDAWGPVHVTLTATTIAWEQAAPPNEHLTPSSVFQCCGRGKFRKRLSVPLREVVAVEAAEPGVLAGSKLGGVDSWLFCAAAPKMHRWILHRIDRCSGNTGRWSCTPVLFGHSESAICTAWTTQINTLIKADQQRPSSVLVLVNPFSGKGLGGQVWEKVAPIFELAKVKTEVIKTQSVGHAFNLMDQATEEQMRQRDGVVVVGGDGLFNEVLNGLLMRRHQAAPAMFPTPSTVPPALSTEDPQSPPVASPYEEHALLEGDTEITREAGGEDVESQNVFRRGGDSSASVAPEPGGGALAARRGLLNLPPLRVGSPEPPPPSPPNPALEKWPSSGRRIRVGVIPAGSTDTVAVSTLGARDPVTAALHVVLGDRLALDVVRITSWEEEHMGGHKVGVPKSPTGGSVGGDEQPKVRYAASFAGYGFYGDVMRDSEGFRWMGPARYDWAGLRTFLKHKRYEAEVTFLEARRASTPHPGHTVRMTGKKSICRVNCATCASAGKREAARRALLRASGVPPGGNVPQEGEDLVWRTVRGEFHSVAGAVMACRNDKAPDGISRHAHLSDGCLDLILIKECSRVQYLQQLLRLAQKGADPTELKIVEAHKTPAFHFKSLGARSTWNVDGELLTARRLSAEVFHGLVDIFARGPEV